MTLPPKFITVLCLVQLFFVTAGFLITCASLKIYDRFTAEMISFHGPRISPLPHFVRAYGLWFLLVPVLWGVIAAARGRVSGRDASVTPPQFVIGIVLTAALVVAFTLSALYAIRASFGPA